MTNKLWITGALLIFTACGKIPDVNLNGSSSQNNLNVNTSSVVPCTTMGGYTAHFSGGSGTTSDPYKISTQSDLQYVWVCPSAAFILENDIIGPYPSVTLAPLGPIGFTFSGTFDGNGHTISNFNIHWTVGNGGTGDNVALFGINTGTIKNITTSNVIVTGHNNVGVIAGTNQGTITNCTVAGGATGNQNVGGAAGTAATGSVTGSSSTATVSGTNSNALVGLYF